MLASLGRSAARVGLGLAAGAAGTAVMTLVQMIEMRVTGREGSTVPAEVVDEVAGIAPEGEEARARLTQLAHWGYGTGLGAFRGLLASTPLPATLADFAFFLGAWGAPMIYLPSLDVAPPPTRWSAKQLAMDGGYHLVYAATVAITWRLLTSQRPVGRDRFRWGG